MYRSFILDALIFGYYLGLLTSVISFPLYKKRFEIVNIIFCTLISCISAIISGVFVMLMLGFSTDSPSSYNNPILLLLPIFVGFFITFIPTIGIKSIVFLIIKFTKRSNVQVDKNL